MQRHQTMFNVTKYGSFWSQWSLLD